MTKLSEEYSQNLSTGYKGDNDDQLTPNEVVLGNWWFITSWNCDSPESKSMIIKARPMIFMNV